MKHRRRSPVDPVIISIALIVFLLGLVIGLSLAVKFIGG